MDTKNLKALATMLDERDEFIYDYLRAAVLQVGEEFIPFLEDRMLEFEDVYLYERAQELIKEIHFKSTAEALIAWRESEKQDLLEGFFLLSKYEYPSLDMELLNVRLSSLSVALWVELEPEMTALEQINVLNRLFFQQEKYTSDKEDPFGLTNMFFNTVLQNKKGNDMSLGILFQLVAQSQNIPIYGVDLPMNYVLAYTKKMNAKAASDILFYINPYNDGIVFDYFELEQHLKGLNVSFKKEDARICNNERTIFRLMKAILQSYSMGNLNKKAKEMRQLIDIVWGTDW